MQISFDSEDGTIAIARLAAWNEREGPRVGDWINMRDGTRRRFTHDWGDGLQTTTPQFGLGSFYLGDGYADYSGALDPTVMRENIEATSEISPGDFWFFHHNFWGAGRAVNVELSCRVFNEKAVVK